MYFDELISLSGSEIFSFLGTSDSLWEELKGLNVYHVSFGEGKIERVKHTMSSNSGIEDFRRTYDASGKANVISFYVIYVSFTNTNYNINTYLAEFSGQLFSYFSFKDGKFSKILFPKNNVLYKKIEIKKHFLKYEINNLFHITHRKNIKSILEHGILNFYNAKKLNTSHIDISNPDVQEKRERTEEHYKRKIHEYSSLYFNPKNAMLRVLWDKKNDLCLLEVSLLALAETEYLISDGNAASHVTKFYNALDQLNLLSWDIILAEKWKDYDDGKRKRCAEVLIYPKIKPEYIKKIYCFSIDTENYLANCGKKIILHKDLF